MKKDLSTYERITKIKEENLKMARQKLPLNVKKIRGTLRKSREIKNSEPLTRGVPKKPAFMTRGASKYWTMLINRLSKIGTITTVDDLSIMILAESLSEYMEMTHFLAKNGRVYEFENSKGETSIRPRPEVKIMNDAWTRIFQMFKQYGLTFQSRGNIAPAPLIQPPNPWANM